MPTYSILITTRLRVPFLINLIRSIYETTTNKEDVEILVIYDTNDIQTDIFVKENFSQIFGTPTIPTSFYCREQSLSLVNDYHNYYARNHAKGRYFMFVNDDAIFESPGWDVRAKEKITEFKQRRPDDILYGMPEDFEREPSRQSHNWMACFPLVSREYLDVMGYVFDPEFTRDGADWALASTFYAINRVIDLRDCIVIRHLSYRSGRRAKDTLDMIQVPASPPLAGTFVARNRAKIVDYLFQKYNIPKELV